MQAITPEQISTWTELIRAGGPLCIVIVVLCGAIAFLWRMVGLPYMDREREISQTKQLAMSDLKQATQNSKDSINAAAIATAHANNITEQLRQELAGQRRN